MSMLAPHPRYGYSCVPYYQCANGSIITDGAGIIDVRCRPDVVVFWPKLGLINFNFRQRYLNLEMLVDFSQHSFRPAKSGKRRKRRLWEISRIWGNFGEISENYDIFWGH